MRVNYKNAKFFWYEDSNCNKSYDLNLSNPLRSAIKLSLITKVLMRKNNLRSKHYFDFFVPSIKFFEQALKIVLH